MLTRRFPRSAMLLARLLVGALSIACDNSLGTTDLSKHVAVVHLAPPAASITVGQTMQLTAIPKNPYGEPLAGRVITWATRDNTVATVSATGLVTAIAVGDLTITATTEGKSGTASITISSLPVASVHVAPETASLRVGLSEQLTATPKTTQGDPLPGRIITWATSDAGVATVSATGIVTGVAVGGPVTITATSEGQSGTATLTVSPVPVAAVALTPATASFPVGLTQQLTANPKDAEGDPLPGRVVTWASSDGGVAVVGATGLVTGIAVGGPVTITATSEGQSGSAAITVTTVPVTSVGMTPATASLTVGLTQQLTATPKDAAGNALPGRTVTWASSNAGVATVSETGLVTGVAIGSPVTITATSEGHSGTAAITVHTVPVVLVNVAPATASLTVGLTQQLTATPKDAAGNALPGRTVTWASSNASVATVSATGL